MNNAAEILKSVQIGLDVCIFLLNTDRGLQATELCNECTTLLQNLDTGIQLDISDVIFHTYYTIFANRKLLETLLNVGILTTQLGDKYEAQSRFVEAKQLFESALAIWKTIGNKQLEGLAHGRLGKKAKEYHEKALTIAIETGDKRGEGIINGNLGAVFDSLSEYQKAKEYLEKALAIAIEIGDKLEEGTSIEVGDKRGEGNINVNLGNIFNSFGEFQKAKEYHGKALVIAIEIGDKRGEGTIYGNLGVVPGEGTSNGNLGVVFNSLGEYQKAKEYHEKALAIAIETGDKRGKGAIYGNLGALFHCRGEGRSNGNLGVVFNSLGEYQKAKEYHEKALAIAIEIGDKQGEGEINSNLGATAKEYHKKALAIAIEIGDRKGEGSTYSSLGDVYFALGKNRKAKEHLDKAVDVGLAIGDRHLEAQATQSLAAVFASVNDFQKAKEHFEKALTFCRECGNRELEAGIYLRLGSLFLSLGESGKAEDHLEKACSISSQIGHKMTEFESLLRITWLKVSQSELVEANECLLRCIRKYEQIRSLLKGNSEFEISLLEECGTFPYQLLTNLLCRTGKFRDALYAEELGRARVLAGFMADKYSLESHFTADPQSWSGIEKSVKTESNCVFLYVSYTERQVLHWVLKGNGDIFCRATREVDIDTLIAEQVCDVEGVFKKSAAGFGVLPEANCEDRSLNDNVTTSLHEESRANLRGDETKDTERTHQLCYKWIVAPVADLLTEPEIIIVPDRFLYRVPFAALRNKSAGKYLSEKYRIRVIPSLTTLRLIQECPADYHSPTGALVVGDPTVGKVHYNGRLTNITPLFHANKEAKMVGRLLGVQPLSGSRATKQAVLQAIPSVSLIHLAAHGNAERGEIALSPQSTTNGIPQEEDYLLTMSEIQGVQVRAKLVVLSCCHSGRGLVKKEGIIGIARAFLASGARSVLVASWAIEDEATAKLMEHFYEHLVRGESASESLHQAVQWLRSNGFPKPSQWAPFVLMGDNVTFDFTKKKE
nr:tetratricopeptide repeat protein 28-like [Pocillopora verrucosa]